MDVSRRPTASSTTPVVIKSVEPSLEPKGGRYIVVHEDGKETTLTIVDKMLQAVVA